VGTWLLRIGRNLVKGKLVDAFAQMYALTGAAILDICLGFQVGFA